MLAAIVIEAHPNLLEAVKDEREASNADDTDGVRHESRRGEVLPPKAIRHRIHHVAMPKLVELFESDRCHREWLTA